jgi:hypothetical protein
VDDGHARVVKTAGEEGGVSRGREDVADVRRDQGVDDRRILLPALDHQIGRDRSVRELAHPAQIGAALRGQGLDHAKAAAFGDGGRELRSRDVRHRRLDDRVAHPEQ